MFGAVRAFLYLASRLSYSFFHTLGFSCKIAFNSIDESKKKTATFRPFCFRSSFVPICAYEYFHRLSDMLAHKMHLLQMCCAAAWRRCRFVNKANILNISTCCIFERRRHTRRSCAAAKNALPIELSNAHRIFCSSIHSARSWCSSYYCAVVAAAV